MVIGFIGGTGPEGLGLAARFCLAGEEVIIGSRDRSRAEEAARKVQERVPDARISGAENSEAAARGEIVFVTVPFAAQRDTLSALADRLTAKLVVTTVVPLHFEKGRATGLHIAEGSAAEQAQAVLPLARVVSAFQNLAAGHLLDVAHPVDADIVVCGEDEEAKAQVMALAEKIQGVRAVDGGPLANSHYVEEITALLLNINRRYKTETHIKIIGLPDHHGQHR